MQELLSKKYVVYGSWVMHNARHNAKIIQQTEGFYVCHLERCTEITKSVNTKEYIDTYILHSEEEKYVYIFRKANVLLILDTVECLTIVFLLKTRKEFQRSNYRNLLCLTTARCGRFCYERKKRSNSLNVYISRSLINDKKHRKTKEK